MTSSDILCSNLFNFNNKIMKIEHKKIFRGQSKILKIISWPINICLKYFMAPTKTLCPPPPHTRIPTYLMYWRLENNLRNFNIRFGSRTYLYLKKQSNNNNNKKQKQKTKIVNRIKTCF